MLRQEATAALATKLRSVSVRNRANSASKVALAFVLTVIPMFQATPAAAGVCTAGVTVPNIKRVGFILIDTVMVYAIGNVSCPGLEPTLVSVCVFGPDDRCEWDADPNGGVVDAEAQVVCFALTPYDSLAVGADANDQGDFAAAGPVTFSLDDCPPVPPIDPGLPPPPPPP